MTARLPSGKFERLLLAGVDSNCKHLYRMTIEILKFNTEAEWLDARRRYVTASEVPTLCGKNKFAEKDAIVKIWKRKMGEEPEFNDSLGFGKRAMYWGQRFQNLLVEEFNSLEPNAFYKPVRNTLIVNDKYPWLAVSPDALGLFAGNNFTGPIPSICEVKIVSEFFRSKFINPDGYTAPDLYMYQLWTQMLVGEYLHGVLLAFIGGNTLAPVYTLGPESEETTSEILEVSRSFHESFISTKTEPPEDWRITRV